jgi:hypothetical protein
MTRVRRSGAEIGLVLVSLGFLSVYFQVVLRPREGPVALVDYLVIVFAFAIAFAGILFIAIHSSSTTREKLRHTPRPNRPRLLGRDATYDFRRLGHPRRSSWGAFRVHEDRKQSDNGFWNHHRCGFRDRALFIQEHFQQAELEMPG